MALRPKNVDLDSALKAGKRVRIGYNPGADGDPNASYYGYAIEVEGGYDTRYSTEDESGVLIFVPGVYLDEFQADED